MDISPIRISVIIVSLQGKEQLARCLTALLQQEDIAPDEIIVPIDDDRQHLCSLKDRFDSVDFLPAAGRQTYARLRARGVAAARGEIVAITEDHCIPEPDWVAAILASHAAPYAAIGGAIEKEVPDSALNWALYLADYLRYMKPMAAGAAHHLTDCNVTYKRTALEKIRSCWQEEFHEPEVHGALQEVGERLWFTPAIVVRQQRSMTWPAALQDRFNFGRLLGGRRVLAAGFGRRLPYMLSAPILPLLLTWRVASQVGQKGRYRRTFVQALPHLVVLNFCWALGEFVGYLTGRPPSAYYPPLTD